jgi:hypothetical protein
MSLPLYPAEEHDRILEYQCQAEAEEAKGLFERDRARGIRNDVESPVALPFFALGLGVAPALAQSAAPVPVKRMADGKPDISGVYQADGGGANQGLEKREATKLTPGGRGVVVDPPDGLLPTQPWARAENEARRAPERGYDDPTAHCFVAGVPRSPTCIAVPDPAAAWLCDAVRTHVVAAGPLDGRAPPDSVRLWQGDSVGHWDGTLVIETKNQRQDLARRTGRRRHAPSRSSSVHRWTATTFLRRRSARPYAGVDAGDAAPSPEQRLLEVACLEDDRDLKHLKDIRDAAAKQ